MIETPKFRTSSYCNTGTCVAVAHTREGAAVRDNKNPDAGQLTVGRSAWASFLDGVRGNQRVAP